MASLAGVSQAIEAIYARVELYEKINEGITLLYRAGGTSTAAHPQYIKCHFQKHKVRSQSHISILIYCTTTFSLRMHSLLKPFCRKRSTIEKLESLGTVLRIVVLGDACKGTKALI